MPSSPELPSPHTTLYRLALGSIGIGVLVLGLKFLAWRLTGSVALYSDALESIINVATAIAAFVAVRVSAMPADDNHPYGHTKAEYLRSEEHTSELQSLIRISYAVFCLKKKNNSPSTRK